MYRHEGVLPFVPLQSLGEKPCLSWAAGLRRERGMQNRCKLSDLQCSVRSCDSWHRASQSTQENKCCIVLSHGLVGSFCHAALLQ